MGLRPYGWIDERIDMVVSFQILEIGNEAVLGKAFSMAVKLKMENQKTKHQTILQTIPGRASHTKCGAPVTSTDVREGTYGTYAYVPGVGLRMVSD